MASIIVSKTKSMALFAFSQRLWSQSKLMANNRSMSSTTSDSVDIKKSVFISQSNDIYTNLALEDWIYTNFNLANHHILMMWSNNPSVVIGRHQNPFTEMDMKYLKDNNIEYARRNSGGGTVFHDRGNLNCTFFTPRDRYNRKYNLNLITRALYREWGIKADIRTPSDDIILQGKKISGTAAKLGRLNAYHHCTLLVNSEKTHLKSALATTETFIKSNATKSVPSPIKNICEANRHVNISQLLSAIGYEFLRTSATELNDGGRELLMQQRGFQLINPTEKWFPGIEEIREQFYSWDWRFAKTPNFTVEKNLKLKPDYDVKVKLTVQKGLISDMCLVLPNAEEISVVSNQIGREYSEASLGNIELSLNNASADNVKQAMGQGL